VALHAMVSTPQPRRATGQSGSEGVLSLIAAALLRHKRVSTTRTQEEAMVHGVTA
jgi:hypothetical protein